MAISFHTLKEKKLQESIILAEYPPGWGHWRRIRSLAKIASKVVQSGQMCCCGEASKESDAICMWSFPLNCSSLKIAKW
ncbi:hypothetical protein T06_13106 [Trichinella sp. T6]|nr:hypothetical protein T06_13106 [Trichinella sp. T6]